MADVESLLDQVWQAYRLDQRQKAVDLGKLAIEEFADHGGAWFALGCAQERLGDLLAADKAFAKSARCTNDPVGTPYRCGWGAFRQVVERARQSLPGALRQALDEVTLELTDYAPPDLLESRDDPELLGLFLGPVKAERDQMPEISPRIMIFRRAHEHSCSTAEEFREEVRKTLLHEFGHYLGYGEDALDKLGMD